MIRLTLICKSTALMLEYEQSKSKLGFYMAIYTSINLEVYGPGLRRTCVVFVGSLYFFTQTLSISGQSIPVLALPGYSLAWRASAGFQNTLTKSRRRKEITMFTHSSAEVIF